MPKLMDGAPDASVAAAERVAPAEGTQRHRVFVAIGLAARNDGGATDDRIAYLTGLSPNSVRPRRGEFTALTGHNTPA